MVLPVILLMRAINCRQFRAPKKGQAGLLPSFHLAPFSHWGFLLPNDCIPPYYWKEKKKKRLECCALSCQWESKTWKITNRPLPPLCDQRGSWPGPGKWAVGRQLGPWDTPAGLQNTPEWRRNCCKNGSPSFFFIFVKNVTGRRGW